jgi:hypothetical protein
MQRTNNQTHVDVSYALVRAIGVFVCLAGMVLLLLLYQTLLPGPILEAESTDGTPRHYNACQV